MALIPPDNSLDFESLIGQLNDQSRLGIQLESASQAYLQHGQWQYHLAWGDEAHVLVESAEIAEGFGKDNPDRKLIARCNRRVEGWGDDDPTMAYFNDYVFVLEALEQIPGLFIFDPNGGSLSST